MRDQDGGALAHHLAQAAQNALFGIGIDAGKRVVQYQDFRLPQNRARQRRALLLAAGKRNAALADHGVEALREALNLARNAGDFSGFETCSSAALVDAEGDIFAQRFAEKKCVLRHVSDRAAQFASGYSRMDRPSIRSVPAAPPTNAQSAPQVWICRFRWGPRWPASSRPGHAD